MSFLDELKKWTHPYDDEDDDFEDALEVVKPKWSNFFMTYVMVSIFTTLWSILFLIPGIIKSYSYSQALYIQAENPDLGWRECIDRSRKMMDGHKFELFTVHLSLIGWMILIVITFGIATIWFVPYLMVISVNYYLRLTNQDNVIEVTGIKVCKCCGSSVKDDFKYCRNCGSIIE